MAKTLDDYLKEKDIPKTHREKFNPFTDSLYIAKSPVSRYNPESREILSDAVIKSFNKMYLWGGLAVLVGGTAIYLMNEEEEQTKETGSVTITIEIP